MNFIKIIKRPVRFFFILLIISTVIICIFGPDYKKNIGLLYIFTGTFAICSTVFREVSLESYYRAQSEGEKPPYKYRFAGILSTNLFEKNLREKLPKTLKGDELSKLKDRDGVIRGFIWIFLGTTLQMTC